MHPIDSKANLLTRHGGKGKCRVYCRVPASHLFYCVCACLVAQPCPTLPMDCSLPGPLVHGISQGRILEQVPSLGYLPNPGDLPDPEIKSTSPSFPVLGKDSLLLSQLGCCCCSVAKSCPTLCDPIDCSPPGSSVHGIL